MLYIEIATPVNVAEQSLSVSESNFSVHSNNIFD